MAKRDVIISALACGGKMSCRKEADTFKEPPVVININSGRGVSTGGGTVQGFRNAAKEYKTDGSIIQGILNTQKNLEPRRICLVSYLSGWSFVHEILKSDDANRIDTVILLEGLNTRSIDPWSHYAANGGRLWAACTRSAHKTASSKSNVWKLQTEWGLVADPKTYKYESVEIPPYIKDVKIDKSISIYSKSESPKTKIFHEDPLDCSFASKRYAGLIYSGKQAQDQTYIQQYVQPRLWRWLKEEWKKPTNGRAF